jgi:hypothetical protein
VTGSDTTPVDYYLGIGIVVDGKRTVIPISVQRDINAGPVQISIDNGQRTAVLMLELYRDHVVVGGWPEGEEWVKHLDLATDRETKITSGPVHDYKPPQGLTVQVRDGWESTYGIIVRAMLTDALLNGDIVVELVGNLDNDRGDAVVRGHVTALIDDVLHFRGGLTMNLDQFGCITLLD